MESLQQGRAVSTEHDDVAESRAQAQYYMPQDNLPQHPLAPPPHLPPPHPMPPPPSVTDKT